MYITFGIFRTIIVCRSPALESQQNWLSFAGHQCCCATICHVKKEGEFVAAAVANKAYSLAREGRLQIPGFPNFSTCTDDLQKIQALESPEYSVCVALADGGLVVKESLIKYWTVTNADYEHEMTDLVTKHNAQWNKNNLKRGLDEEGDGASTQPAKKLKVDNQKPRDHEDQIEDRTHSGTNQSHF